MSVQAVTSQVGPGAEPAMRREYSVYFEDDGVRTPTFKNRKTAEETIAAFQRHGGRSVRIQSRVVGEWADA